MKRSAPAAICCARRITRRAMAGGSASERVGVELDAARRLRNEARRSRSRGILEIVGVFARDRGLAIEDIDDSRRKARVEQRQQLVTDAIARNRQIGVRRVLAKRDAGGAQKLAHVRARRLDERPHDDAGARMDAAEPARPCAAQQAQQKRFGLIVFRVRDGDGGRAETRCGAIEERVPRHVRRMFDGRARLARERCDVDALDVDRHLEPGSEVAAELRVCIRLGAAKLMVQMRRAGDAESRSASAISRSANSSATESAPPDNATTTRLPVGSNP